jgi:hypothetical protein
VNGRPSLKTKDESVKCGALPPRRHPSAKMWGGRKRRSCWTSTPSTDRRHLAHIHTYTHHRTHRLWLVPGHGRPDISECAQRIAYAWPHTIYSLRTETSLLRLQVDFTPPTRMRAHTIPKYSTACHEFLVAEGQRSMQSPKVGGKLEFQLFKS